MMMTTEEWRPAPGYKGCYEVSSLGRVRSLSRPRHPGRILKPQPGPSGYLRVHLSRDGVRRHRKIHVLVARAFLGERPPGLEVRHLDGNHANNVITNLTYGTRSENQLDRVRHGTHSMSIKNACPQGHPYDAVTPDGVRYCKICKRDKTRAWRARRRLPADNSG